MRRMISYVMLLTIIFGVITYISDNLSSPPPIFLQELGLSRCGTDLCVGAVQPSTMSWEITRAILSADPDIIFDDYGATKYKKDIRIWMGFWKDKNTYLQIYDVKQAGLMYFHELIDLFGDPCGVTLTSAVTDFDIVLEFPLIIAEINLGTWKSTESLSPEMVINSLEIWPENPQCKERLTFPSSFNVSLNWCGFASFDHYLRHCRKPD